MTQRQENVLREEIDCLRAKVSTLESYLTERDKVNDGLIDEIEQLSAQIADFQAGVVPVPDQVRMLTAENERLAAEKEHYRLALAAIERVLHQLGNGCEFQPCHDCDTQEAA